MRTPTEIFEAVLRAWGGDMEALWSESPHPRPHLEQHRAKAAAYREEFRQAMAGRPGGLPPVPRCAFLVQEDYRHRLVPCGALAPDYVSRDDGSPRCYQHNAGARRVTPWPVPLSAPEQALADANPSTYVPPEPAASAEEAFQGTCPPVPSREPFFMSAEGIVKVAQAVAFGSEISVPAGPAREVAVEFYDDGSVTVADPDEEYEDFRRRRDESAERYTKDDGSRR